ncbi:hypothetical protein B0H15DRAFT_950017 [Mycena belliarum]|uniref:Uncharacterized protein n=1 Tax=Mycena belliarum TaxID=1033014 RepID=A0AAD6U3C5_9AGAR|nr:hypothetical protein B0H15DRAFT_950017 [Mycena belliae]
MTNFLILRSDEGDYDSHTDTDSSKEAGRQLSSSAWHILAHRIYAGVGVGVGVPRRSLSLDYRLVVNTDNRTDDAPISIYSNVNAHAASWFYSGYSGVFWSWKLDLTLTLSARYQLVAGRSFVTGRKYSGLSGTWKVDPTRIVRPSLNVRYQLVPGLSYASSAARSDKIISAADVEDKDPARVTRRFVPSSHLPRVDRSDPQKARYHAPLATKRCPALPVDPSVRASPAPRSAPGEQSGERATTRPRAHPTARLAFSFHLEAQAAPRLSRSLSPVNTGTGSCFLSVLVFLVSQTASAPAPPLICLAPHDAATRRALTYALRCPTA